VLRFKPRLEHREKLLRRHRCTICHKVLVGYHSARQCSDTCRAEAIRARGRISQRKIRDERREPLGSVRCRWCKELMPRQRVTKRCCSDRCQAALLRFREQDGNEARRQDAISIQHIPSGHRIAGDVSPPRAQGGFDCGYPKSKRRRVQNADACCWAAGRPWAANIALCNAPRRIRILDRTLSLIMRDGEWR
jgi:hypothetical protein